MGIQIPTCYGSEITLWKVPENRNFKAIFLEAKQVILIKAA